MLDEPLEFFLVYVFGQRQVHGIRTPVPAGYAGMLTGFFSPGLCSGEILKLSLACRMLIRPAVTFVEQVFYNVRERHISLLEREKRLIHVRVNPDRPPLSCTRHNYHFVVTIYKYF